MRGIVIAGTHSGAGKTTVTLGIMAALRKKGLSVQPFKAGPDFIDAGLHRLAAGRTSRNLDIWMCGEEYVRKCFARHGAAADIAVIEGVMGLYDGDRSTASLAALLQVPVILVVDAYGMAESAGAMVQGYRDFGMGSANLGVKLAGVVFNRVASESHYARLRDSVHDVPVLGFLMRELSFDIPHRHLGLSTAEEDPIGRDNLQKLADTVLRHIDIERIIGAADLGTGRERTAGYASEAGKSGRVRIAVAWDKAFSFYYEDNLDLLRDAGADIVCFSPLVEAAIPADADALYIGGGYPELYAEELSLNGPMRESIRSFVEAGKPVYAECGGMMYLSRSIARDSGEVQMAGVFPFGTRMLGKPRLGYREVVLRADGILGQNGETCRGHEFHYSEIVESMPGTLYRVRDSRGNVLPDEGFQYKRALASYIHLHFGSNGQCASRFISYIKGGMNA